MTPGASTARDLLKLHLCVPEVAEEASTVAEQHWNNVALKLAQQSRCQVLLSNAAAAPKHDVFAADGLPCLFERGLDSVGGEVKRGPSLHLHGITRVMGEDEHGVVVGRVEVVENALLASRGAWDGIPGQSAPWPSNLRVELHEEDGKTRLVLREGPYPPGTADLGRQAWKMMFPKLWSVLRS